ncbi:MAG TPA: LamG-like jellyroll fold domain-containing protein [Clostridia bacterium]|nr:LamG-like jellyroll fold domain-containing protein [Clostridia bacterium]
MPELSRNQPKVPDHQLLRLIGRGSYGEVWLARSTLGTLRAVKIIYQKTFRDSRPFDRELRGVQRFEPVSRLHSGLIGILHVGQNEAEGFFYCVMEVADDVASGQQIDLLTYVPRTLAQEIARHKRLPVERCLEVAIGITSGLAFLHGRGLIHRDIKPSNIVFVGGVPKLGDIGLVVEMAEARSYVGTEGFIPPEGPGTVQADIYSFGKVLYEITTGKDRYDYPELPSLLDKTEHSPELLRLNQVVVRCCRTKPQERYSSVLEVEADLKAIQSGRAPVVARKARGAWPVGVVVALGLMVLLTVIATGKHLTRSARALQPSPVPLARDPGLPGLAGFWHAEGDGLDSAGSRHAETTAGISYGPGRAGLAFDFDGIDSVITVPAAERLESLTLAAWVYPKDIGLPRPILEYGGHDGTHSPLHIWYSIAPGVNGVPGSVYAVIRGDTDKGLELATGGGVMRAYEWTHVALTYDYASSTARMYVNGVERASKSSPVRIRPNTGLPLYFGYRSGKTADLWAGWRHLGKLDEVCLYNRALTAQEVVVLHSAVEGRSSVPESE